MLVSRTPQTTERERFRVIKGIDIAAYLVRDPQAQIAFYRDVFGMKPTEIDHRRPRRGVHPGRRLDVRRVEARGRGDRRGDDVRRRRREASRGALSRARAYAQRRRSSRRSVHGLRFRSGRQRDHHPSAQGVTRQRVAEPARAALRAARRARRASCKSDHAIALEQRNLAARKRHAHERSVFASAESTSAGQ